MYPNRRSAKSPGEQTGMIYGIRPVMEAVLAGKEIEKIFIASSASGELMQELKKNLKANNITWQQVPVEKLNRLTTKNHQDVVCFLSAVAYANLEMVLPTIFERGETPLILMLDRLTDVRNFGAIARTAECAGVHAIVIPTRGAAQINADAVKTSAGALHKIAICRETNLKNTLEYLKQSGLQVIACTEKSAKNYDEAPLTSPLVLIFGSEEDGISAELLKLCDERIKIPMMGTIESLNVSVACGIVLFECLRQRKSGV